ncbi:MAG: hypothetical protein IKZ62_00520 [Prevotella sp.]|nr:hypothetical protein [Prevotella sp.]
MKNEGMTYRTLQGMKAFSFLISLLLLAVGCSSSDGTEEKQPTMLTVYVYSPEHPMLIRAAIGDVDALAAESKIDKLQMWIFERGTGNLVGYLNTTATDALNSNEGATYQIAVDDDFARYKPNVDIYVLANVMNSNCGCAFNENSTRDYLKDHAKLTESHFGLSSLVSTSFFSTEPPGVLPMVGVLNDQPVFGDAPVLRIGTQNNIATVKLERAVSKVRFVFANKNITNESAKKLSITGISLNAQMIPTEEYLIPQDKTLTYNTSSVSLLPSTIDEVEKTDDPLKFIYDGQAAQAYENSINAAVAANELTVVGPYYLRESDQRLAGTISYSVDDVAKTPATFQMEAAGDFVRNRSWIVYAYYTGGDYLEINSLYIKDWTNKSVDYEVYNW